MATATKPISKRSVQRTFAQVVQSVGLKKKGLCPHTLKHSYATAMRAASHGRLDLKTNAFVEAETKAYNSVMQHGVRDRSWPVNVCHSLSGGYPIWQHAVTALYFSRYLLECTPPDRRDIKLAEEVARRAEDTGIDWHRAAAGPQSGQSTPHVNRIDCYDNESIASNMLAAIAFEDLAQATKNPLWSAKARALATAVLQAQHPRTGHSNSGLEPKVAGHDSRQFNDAKFRHWDFSRGWTAQMLREYATLRGDRVIIRLRSTRTIQDKEHAMKHGLRSLFFTPVICYATLANAGYEQPAYIDGCQSIDGRFVITAKQTVRGKTVHGPHKWDFVWKDIKTDETRRFSAQGIQGGQVYAQLFMAPDGETFALWNHITQYWPEKSHLHSHNVLPKREEVGEEKNRELDIHEKRLIIYRKDGSIIKEFGVGDFLRDEEWESVLAVFTRVHWLQEYDDLTYRDICRMQYSFYRVSPDYTLLEFRPVPSRVKRKDPPRVVRVSLTDGRILDESTTSNSSSSETPTLPHDERSAKTPVAPTADL